MNNTVPRSKATPTTARWNHEKMKPSFTPPYYDVTSPLRLHQRKSPFNGTPQQNADRLKCCGFWKLELPKTPYRNLLRITTASTTSMINHIQIATPTLKNETPMESKKMAGIVRPRLRKKRTVVGSWGSSSSRSFLVEYQCMAVKSSLPIARVAA